MEQSIKGVVNPWKVQGGVKSNPIPPMMMQLELIQVSTGSAPEAQGWESTVAAKAITAPRKWFTPRDRELMAKPCSS